MQAQLYPIIDHVVKFCLTLEKYDRIFYFRNKNEGGMGYRTCLKCLASFNIKNKTTCPRCGSLPNDWLRTYQPGKLAARKIRVQLKTELKQDPFGFPVNLEVVYLHSAENKIYDLDNILQVVMSIICESIIFDDALVQDVRIRYHTGTGNDSQVFVTVAPWLHSKSNLSFSPSDVAALFSLQDRFAGKQVYIPKNIQKLLTICEADVRAKLWPLFEKVKKTGHNYANVISLVKDSDASMKYLSNRNIIKEWRKWRISND